MLWNLSCVHVLFFSQVKGPSSAASVVPPLLRRATCYVTSNFTLERNPLSVTYVTMPAAEEMPLLDTFAHILVNYSPPSEQHLKNATFIVFWGSFYSTQTQHTAPS